jgi:hypothetical protein
MLGGEVHSDDLLMYVILKNGRVVTVVSNQRAAESYCRRKRGCKWEYRE